jgi:hypothetical protein
MYRAQFSPSSSMARQTTGMFVFSTPSNRRWKFFLLIGCGSSSTLFFGG